MNKTADYTFTIIVPVYNEQDNMSRLEQTLSAYLEKAVVKSSVLFVNDGSSDNSLSRIKEICDNHPDFFYISFSRNCGLSAALKAGIDYIQSEFTGYIDADLQTNPDDFNLLLPYAKDYGLVTGIRVNRQDSKFKLLQSKIANGFRRRMTGDTAQDTGCPLKVMKTDVAKRLPFFTGMHRFLSALMLLEGEQTKQIPVRHYPRTAGESKFHLSNRLKGPFLDCFAYRWMRSRYIKYDVNEKSL